MFESKIKLIEQDGKSIFAYNKAAAALRKAAAAEPRDAAGHLLLALSAEQFLEENERMPLKAQQVTEAYEDISADAAKLDAARAGGAQKYLGVLEALAQKLAAR